MQALREWLTRLLSVFRPNRDDADLEAELRLHLELEAEAEQRRSGVDVIAARREVRARAGAVTQTMDAVRDQRGLGWLEALAHDVRYAIRLVVRQPRFSLIVIMTIALATGLSTSLFSVVDATLVRPVRWSHPEQLMNAGVLFTWTEDNRTFVFSRASVSDMRRWRTTAVVAGAAAYVERVQDAVVTGAAAKRVGARSVTEGYFGLYGTAPELGRDFVLADTDPSAPPVVMVSHVYWQNDLGADPSAIGRVLRFDSISAEIIGVAPSGFDAAVTLWRPIKVNVDARGGVTAMVRLRDGIDVDAAARQLSAVTPIGTRQTAADGDGSLGGKVRLTSVLDEVVGQKKNSVTMLAGAVALIVLIACVNIAGLLLARGAGRETELAVRASLGAGRGRLLRQLLIESVTLAVLGGIAGFLLASLSLDALQAILPVRFEPGMAATINLRVLLATAVFTMGTGLAFGIVPAIRLSRASVTGGIARNARRPATLSRRSGQTIIAAEVALAVVLLSGAGLMVRSFVRLMSIDLGFDPRAVVAFTTVPVQSATDAQTQYFRELLRQIRELPDVAAAGAVDFFALGGSSISQGITVAGQNTGASIRQVLPGYFEALDLHVVEGEVPTIADADAGRSVAVINLSAARKLFQGDALGQPVLYNGKSFTVIGVVSDFRTAGQWNEIYPEVFFPFQPVATRNRVAIGLTVVVRPRPGASNLVERLRHLAEHSGAAIVDDARPGTEWFSDLVERPRHQTVLIGLLGLFGLTLTLVGVFSTTAYAVVRRTPEIGVRMALGARPGDVVIHMVKDAGWPTIVGLVCGLAGAFYATRIIESMLFNTAPHDPATFVAISALTAVSMLVASWIPARRAARIDPISALRTE